MYSSFRWYFRILGGHLVKTKLCLTPRPWTVAPKSSQSMILRVRIFKWITFLLRDLSNTGTEPWCSCIAADSYHLSHQWSPVRILASLRIYSININYRFFANTQMFLTQYDLLSHAISMGLIARLVKSQPAMQKIQVDSWVGRSSWRKDHSGPSGSPLWLR